MAIQKQDQEEREQEEREVSWYEFACAYVDIKWPEVAPNSRRAIADALATATPALLTTKRGAPKPAHLRKALYGWAFNTKLREAGLPADLAPAIRWVERNTVPLTDLADPDVLRRVLNQLARKLDGTPAAATVVARKRAVLFNLLGYAVDKKHFPMNPLMSVRWKSPKVAEAIDRRRVVNPRQARALLDALAEQGPMGRHLVAFFGCIYHAGLRPAEVVMLTRDESSYPTATASGDGSTSASRPPPPAVPGTKPAPAANAATSNTAPSKRSARSRSPQRSPACCATTSPSTTPPPTAACSAAKAATCSPTPSAHAPGRRPARPP